jgi:hypothetical protein
MTEITDSGGIVLIVVSSVLRAPDCKTFGALANRAGRFHA